METTDVQNKFIFRYHSVLIIDVLPKYFYAITMNYLFK